MPRAGLSSDVVVDRARALVDERGLEALTLARVASELGVAAPSLYKHIDGIDDLIVRIAVAVTTEFGEKLGKATSGLSARAALEAMAQEYRRFAHEHPATYPLTQRHMDDEMWEAAAARVLSCVVEALASYGIVATDVDRIRYVRSSVHGFLDLERTGGFGLPTSVDESFRFLIDAMDATLTALDRRS